MIPEGKHTFHRHHLQKQIYKPEHALTRRCRLAVMLFSDIFQLGSQNLSCHIIICLIPICNIFHCSAIIKKHFQFSSAQLPFKTYLKQKNRKSGWKLKTTAKYRVFIQTPRKAFISQPSSLGWKREYTLNISFQKINIIIALC